MLALKISVYSVVFFFLGIFVFGFLRAIQAAPPAAKTWKIESASRTDRATHWSERTGN